MLVSPNERRRHVHVRTGRETRCPRHRADEVDAPAPAPAGNQRRHDSPSVARRAAQHRHLSSEHLTSCRLGFHSARPWKQPRQGHPMRPNCPQATPQIDPCHHLPRAAQDADQPAWPVATKHTWPASLTSSPPPTRLRLIHRRCPFACPPPAPSFPDPSSPAHTIQLPRRRACSAVSVQRAPREAASPPRPPRTDGAVTRDRPGQVTQTARRLASRSDSAALDSTQAAGPAAAPRRGDTAC